ncbi:hypothetical protein ACFW2V_25150 [Streptomyces sp. NPDC058947]|uniref:hypothetical protein n=1 Tax=Streptomyces sp. NPDC058947 TaxID=3346675 RepID=UPI0036B89381
MKERQIEAMYRARFEERRRATEALDALLTDVSAGRDTHNRAWLLDVAHSRVPHLPERLTRDGARTVLNRTQEVALTYASMTYASRRGIHPLEDVDRLNPRPDLRRWVCVNTTRSERSRWREAWLAIHHDGSVFLAAEPAHCWSCPAGIAASTAASISWSKCRRRSPPRRRGGIPNASGIRLVGAAFLHPRRGAYDFRGADLLIRFARAGALEDRDQK